jgi:zinc protease
VKHTTAPILLFAALLFAAPAGSTAQTSAVQSGGGAPAARPKAGRPVTRAATPPVQVTSVEGITEYLLANGLHVLLFPDQTKATATVNMTYMVGSRHENYGETGMAHLLEHLLFKGTPKHPNIPQELTSHGSRPNGSTWFDRTNYFETFQATDENLLWALELEADRMVHSFVAKKDLDSEMTVVRNEFEMGENSPGAILGERVLSTAYLWHNYGHSTIGARADLENVPIDRLQAFYRKYYQPDNAYLLVAGKFDQAKTLALIEKIFSSIPKPTRDLPRTYTAEPVQDGERRVELRRVGDVQFVAVAYHVPAAAHPDAASVAVLEEVLGSAPAGRLHKALVETKKASSIGTEFLFLHDPAYLLLNAEVRQESPLADAERTMLTTIDGAVTQPITKEEVERARTTLLKNVDLMLNSSERVGLELSEWIGAGDWRMLFLNRDRIRKATAEDVQRAAATYLKPANRTVGVFIPTAQPDRTEVPATPDLTALLKDYKGDTAIAAGEAFDPSPASIEGRTTRSTLPSGLKVALLPKKTRGATVVAAMTLRFGDEKSLVNTSSIADLTADMLMRGTTKHTRQELKDELDRLKARVAIAGGPTQVTASVETIHDNFAAALTLLAEMLQSPAFPASELDQLKEQNLAAIEQQRMEPSDMASNAFSRHANPYPKGDVRYVPTPQEAAEEYQAATLDQVKAFHAGFYGASVGELAVVGDFEAAAVSKQVAELFGSWKSPHGFTRVARPYQAVDTLRTSIEAPDKANAFFIAGLNLKLRDDDPDYPAMVLGNYMLGGGFLNSRLAVRIRQKEGLSYGVGSQFSASPLDQAGSFVAYAIYAPQNAAKLEAAFSEEIERVVSQGFTDQEVKEAKSGLLQGRQVGRAQDAPLARTVGTYLFLGRTLAWDADLESKVAALTPAQVQDAMKRHITASAISIVKAGDFAKAAAAPPSGPVQ